MIVALPLGAARLLAVLLLAICMVAAPAEAAFKVQKVVSPGGIEAWLLEDHRVPIMALNLSFRGGAALDPAGKEGLALMTASLMDEGAGDLNANVFQKELADDSIGFSFSADQDSFSGAIKTLTVHRDRAFALLATALAKPRFDADAIERVRNEMITSIATSMGNPNWVARRTLMETLFAGHPYARPSNGTIDSLRAITADDLRQFIGRRVGRDQLLVTAAGDITPEELGPALDTIFAGVPAKAEPFQIPNVTAKATGETITITRAIPQTVIIMGEPGMERTNPDWFAGQVVNYALGGGGFSSRLMEDVRGAGAKKGLSYGISSNFVPYQHSGLVLAGGSTKNATAGEVLDIIKGEFGKVHDDGITEAEMNDAKVYISGSFPLSLTSTDRLSALLMQLRVNDHGIDYLDKRDAQIDAVTLQDTQRVARALLDPAKLTSVLVGQPQGLPAAATKTAAPSGASQ
jgi:zinc protease